jgi:hypothetical protein
VVGFFIVSSLSQCMIDIYNFETLRLHLSHRLASVICNYLLATLSVAASALRIC